MEGWVLISTGAGIVISVVGITKIMLSSAVGSIKEHCKTQTTHCAQRFTGIEADNNAAWDRVNTHGHKGLDSNGSKVTV